MCSFRGTGRKNPFSGSQGFESHRPRQVKEIIQEHFKPQGFNIGANCGDAAGQTVFHAHIHVIPRYTGDVPNPRGGVRNIIPGKGSY
jgi:ATP adenylyltransferase